MPVNASEISGKNVPQKITTQSPTSSRLLTRKIASRESSESIRRSSAGRRGARRSARPSPGRRPRSGRAAARPPSRPRRRGSTRGRRSARGTSPAGERERGDDQRDVPDLQHPAALLDHDRVQERGPDQPRHQRRVLDRVPAPVAAPAELAVRPAGAEQDPDRRGRSRRPARSAGSSGSSSRRAAGRPARRSRTRTGSRTTT